MAQNTRPHRSLSEGFGRVGQQTHDPVSAACLRIAYLRAQVIDYANRHNAYIRDKNKFIIGLQPDTCTAELTEMTALFNTLGYSHALQTQANLHAGKSARSFRESETAQRVCAQWPTLPEDAKIAALKIMSKAMIHEINREEEIILNAPSIVRATLAQGVAMQVSAYTNETHKMDFLIVAINRPTLAHTDFDNTAAMLWHEHEHVFMANLCAAYDCGWITPDHELYEDARKSSIIAAHNILGNSFLSYETYRAEPEEKLCHQSQNVFYRVLRYQPPAAVNGPTP